MGASEWVGACGSVLYTFNNIRSHPAPTSIFLPTYFSWDLLFSKLQPNEAVYLKMSNKRPGLLGGVARTDMDLSYKQKFPEECKYLPDAYERLILDVVRGAYVCFLTICLVLHTRSRSVKGIILRPSISDASN